ncbi:MAG: bacteriocin system transporter, ATP-binding protein [Firmicutes bacterium]|nr:bacteriocin system transporter, ATP-binding protein [Bacillota bacterium]
MANEAAMMNTLLTIDGQMPILLNDPDVLWIVQSGAVDVFTVAIQDGQPKGKRSHIFKAEVGQVLFGMEHERSVGLLICGIPGTTILKRNIPQAIQLLRQRQDIMFAEPLIFFIESCIIGLTTGFSEMAAPNCFKRLVPGGNLVIEGDSAIRTNESIIWFRHVRGQSRYMELADIVINEESGWFPLTEYTWLYADNGSELVTTYSIDMIGAKFEIDVLWSALKTYYQRAIDYIVLSQQQASQLERERIKEKSAQEQDLLNQAFVMAVTDRVRGSETMESWADPLMQACQCVAERLKIKLNRGPDQSGVLGLSLENRLLRVANASRFNIRQVLLDVEWWENDNGPLLAFMVEDNRPVALLPVAATRYEYYDPANNTRTLVDRQLAEKMIKPQAYTFYRSFPERALTGWDLVKMGIGNCWKMDMVVVALMAVVSGLLGIVVPAATGVLFDIIIPEAERSRLWQMVLLMLIAVVADFMFQVTRAIAWMRLEGRLDGAVQAAVWDRLLNLPVVFFRRFSVGDLAVRANGIAMIRQVVSGVVIMTGFAGVISLFNLGLLFYYNRTLAATATGLAVFFLTIICLLSYTLLRYQRTLSMLEGKISGTVLGLISGITKIRVIGAESRMFYLWAQDFNQQRLITADSRHVVNVLAVLSSCYPLLISMTVFFLATGLVGDVMSTGEFLAFNFAFMTFMSAMMSVVTAVIIALPVIPVYERIKPILETMPEVDKSRECPGELTGRIEVTRLSFQYQNDGPLILQDVALHINPGDFVAIVGASGSGKSTLLRLLLGFEQPSAGGVFYDGQELGALDVRAVRRQLGVVLQSGSLMAGDIFSNIAGASSVELSEAWEAARMAGIEEDIKEMPMGMHTFVNEGASTLSGGQRQRLLIARAIVKKPRIIFFDEATSALDNKTQSIISESLEQLQATRIVIAHRLSTIVNADRIYVMDRGQIVQQGTYKELMDEPGLFAMMAKRQLA